MKNTSRRVFITGIAGFIGFHLALALKKRGERVIGCDNFNAYYDPQLKRRRAEILHTQGIEVLEKDITLKDSLTDCLKQNQITHLVHLAAQAGVRRSVTHPEEYQQNNSQGFFYLLETLRQMPTIKLIYASSSSVYGLNKKVPFSEEDMTDQPANFYGATKKANELMAHAYHHLYGIHAIGLRFFTVYGPWGRPDMAYFSFTKAILEEKPIKLFNEGDMQRDFTYIDDIVDGIVAALACKSAFDVFNLGNHEPKPIMKLIQLIEDFTGKKALIEKLPMPKGEIPITYAAIEKAQAHLGFSPKTSLEEGMGHFLSWYFKIDRRFGGYLAAG